MRLRIQIGSRACATTRSDSGAHAHTAATARTRTVRAARALRAHSKVRLPISTPSAQRAHCAHIKKCDCQLKSATTRSKARAEERAHTRPRQRARAQCAQRAQRAHCAHIKKCDCQLNLAVALVRKTRGQGRTKRGHEQARHCAHVCRATRAARALRAH
jgi:hypothetical protein